jgi:hypothetical protein
MWNASDIPICARAKNKSFTSGTVEFPPFRVKLSGRASSSDFRRVLSSTQDSVSGRRADDDLLSELRETWQMILTIDGIRGVSDGRDMEDVKVQLDECESERVRSCDGFVVIAL